MGGKTTQSGAFTVILTSPGVLIFHSSTNCSTNIRHVLGNFPISLSISKNIHYLVTANNLPWLSTCAECLATSRVIKYTSKSAKILFQIIVIHGRSHSHKMCICVCGCTVEYSPLPPQQVRATCCFRLLRLLYEPREEKCNTGIC